MGPRTDRRPFSAMRAAVSGGDGLRGHGRRPIPPRQHNAAPATPREETPAAMATFVPSRVSDAAQRAGRIHWGFRAQRVSHAAANDAEQPRRQRVFGGLRQGKSPLNRPGRVARCDLTPFRAKPPSGSENQLWRLTAALHRAPEPRITKTLRAIRTIPAAPHGAARRVGCSARRPFPRGQSGVDSPPGQPARGHSVGLVERSPRGVKAQQGLCPITPV